MPKRCAVKVIKTISQLIFDTISYRPNGFFLRPARKRNWWDSWSCCRSPRCNYESIKASLNSSSKAFKAAHCKFEVDVCRSTTTTNMLRMQRRCLLPTGESKCFVPPACLSDWQPSSQACKMLSAAVVDLVVRCQEPLWHLRSCAIE